MAYHNVINHTFFDELKHNENDDRFQRIEDNIKELKDSIKFLADVVYDEINSKKKRETEKPEKPEKTEKLEKADKPEKESRIVTWIKTPTFVYGATIVIGTLASYATYGLYGRFFSDKNKL